MKSLSSPIILIRRSFELFFERENMKYFVKIYLVLIPFQLFFLYQNYFVTSQSRLLDTTNTYTILARYPLFLVSVVLINLAFIVASFLVDLAAVKAVGGVVNKNSISLSELFKFAKTRVWPFALLTIATGLLQVLGFVFFIIPGVILGVWYAFVKFVFVEKGLGVRASMKASRDLSAGKFWPVLGRLAVLLVFLILLQTFFALIPFGVGPVLAQLFGAFQMLPFYLLYRELTA